MVTIGILPVRPAGAGTWEGKSEEADLIGRGTSATPAPADNEVLQGFVKTIKKSS
jgi:hypothetical protein